MKKFYLINVPSKYGYSFMIHTSETSEEAIINIASEMNLFTDADDAELANVSEADEHDQQFFKEYTVLN